MNRTLPPVVMSPGLLHALCVHARETHPEECCGLLTGRVVGSFEVAHRCRNDMTRLHQRAPHTHPRDGRTAFHMNEADVVRVAEEAEGQHRLVTGVYHSHADAGPYFSALDQEFACQPGFPFPLAQHVVISVLDGMVGESAVFRRIDGPPGFEGRVLIGGTP